MMRFRILMGTWNWRWSEVKSEVSKQLKRDKRRESHGS